MDVVSVGMALAMTGGAEESAIKAAAAAREAAQAATTAAGTANKAATDANNAAGKYSTLDSDAAIDRAAFNYAYTTMQAELRDQQKRMKAAETKLSSLK